MDTDLTAIEVQGVPDGFPADRMIDKLTIHFLRPRNRGGEVLRVVYPLQTPRRAFVVFEHPDVAAHVLQGEHVLQVDKQSFPLKVTPVERSQVDLPVKTTLDLSKFPDKEAVLSVLRRYGFKVTRQNSAQLLLEGSFLRLSAARAKLAELLSSDGQSQSSFPEPRPSDHSAGAVPKCRLSPDADLLYGWNGAVVHPGSWSPEEAEASSFTPTRRPDVARPPDSLLGRPYSVPPRLREKASFQVDAHALHYARSFHGDRVNDILKAHGVEMEVADTGGSELSDVALVGSEAPLAKEKLTRLLQEVQRDLRMQEIPLSSLSLEQQQQVPKRAQTYSDVHKVLVLQEDDTLLLVGSSAESYEVKQSILGRDRSRPSSRQESSAMELGGRVRRSSSLPRQPSKAAARDWEPVAVAAPVGAAAGGYAPSKYDDGPGGKGSRRGRAADPAPPTDPSRKRSLSESRAKLKEGRATPEKGGNHRAPPAGSPTTTEKEQSPGKNKPPQLLNNLLTTRFNNVTKNLFSKNSKSKH